MIEVGSILQVTTTAHFSFLTKKYTTAQHTIGIKVGKKEKKVCLKMVSSLDCWTGFDKEGKKVRR